jgi:hypothetical protein
MECARFLFSCKHGQAYEETFCCTGKTNNHLRNELRGSCVLITGLKNITAYEQNKTAYALSYFFLKNIICSIQFNNFKEIIIGQINYLISINSFQTAICPETRLTYALKQPYALKAICPQTAICHGSNCDDRGANNLKPPRKCHGFRAYFLYDATETASKHLYALSYFSAKKPSVVYSSLF